MYIIWHPTAFQLSCHQIFISAGCRRINEMFKGHHVRQGRRRGLHKFLLCFFGTQLSDELKGKYEDHFCCQQLGRPLFCWFCRVCVRHPTHLRKKKNWSLCKPKASLSSIASIRKERLRATFVVYSPGVRHKCSSYCEPQACWQEELPSKRFNLIISIACQQGRSPNAQNSWDRSSQTSFHIVDGIPGITNTQMEHQDQNGGVTKMSHLLPNHHGASCTEGRHNQDPHDGEKDTWRGPARHFTVIEAPCGFTLGGFLDIWPGIVQRWKKTRPKAHAKEKAKNRPVWQLNAIRLHSRVQRSKKSGDGNQLHTDGRKVLANCLCIQLFVPGVPCSHRQGCWTQPCLGKSCCVTQGTLHPLHTLRRCWRWHKTQAEPC